MYTTTTQKPKRERSRSSSLGSSDGSADSSESSQKRRRKSLEQPSAIGSDDLHSGSVVLRRRRSESSVSADEGIFSLIPGAAATQEQCDANLLHLVVSILDGWKMGSKGPLKNLLTEVNLRQLLQRVRPVLMSQPTLVRVQAPVNVCGDIHGQIHDLADILKTGGLPPDSRYVFLGDYVDRGKFGTEVITVLLGLKVLYPTQIYLLRGNHESDSICRIYGFFDEVKRRFSIKLFKEFTDVFNCLPLSALIEDIALCMHGGISPELHSVKQIEQLPRPLVVPDEGLACDILWADPEEGQRGWGPSERGVSFTFGADVVKSVCDKLGVDIILRAHQVVDSGYAFFAGRRLVTIFSASNYCGEFTNNGAMLRMDEDCKCSFQIFKPNYGVTMGGKS